MGPEGAAGRSPEMGVSDGATPSPVSGVSSTTEVPGSSTTAEVLATLSIDRS